MPQQQFCCKKAMNATLMGLDCGRQDLVFIGNREPAAAWTRDLALEICFVFATNAAFALPLSMLWRRRRASDTATGVATMLTSALYHYCDTTRRTVFGMTAGNWHRLDNVFAIVSMNALVPLLLGPASDDKKRQLEDAFRWSSLVIALFFQELNPWHLGCMLAPVLGGFAFYALWACYAAPRGHAQKFLTRGFAAGCAALAVSLFFFALGLDEARDVFRMWHGLWHVFNAAAAALFIAALLPFDGSPQKGDALLHVE
ncbi:hypothetical protein M885DRAFT_518884 [Pelagophyceae sp. CCMP2097]|nr:hypothetical protein M885DRAFT_518884 [Pelagophyceae sp. CCMP2097]